MRISNNRLPLFKSPTAPQPPVQAARPDVAPSPLHESGFFDHLKDAIASNKQRKEIYSGLSGGQSEKLSNLLILSEVLSLPFALLYDHKAKSFQEKGLPVVSGDFVSMKKLPPPETPPRYRNVASEATFHQVKEGIEAYEKSLGAALKKKDFTEAAALTHEFVRSIEAIEEQNGCHFAMLRHVADSIGYAALHASDNSRLSGGSSDSLSASFIKLQMRSLDLIEDLDKQAQEMHHLGIGIVVNDVPHIPFMEEWEKKVSSP